MSSRRPEGSMADRYRIGLATLNYLPRIIYYLHVRDDFTFPEIAFRLGASVWEVEEQFAAALAHLDRAVHSEG